MANELVKAANLRLRFEGVVFFWQLLRGTDHRSAHKRVKTFFARGNGVRRRSRLRRCLLLPKQSNGNQHQCSKHKTKCFVHGHTFRGIMTPSGDSAEHPQPTIRIKSQIVSVFRRSFRTEMSERCAPDSRRLVGPFRSLQSANAFHEKAGECQTFLSFFSLFSFFFFLSFFLSSFPNCSR